MVSCIAMAHSTELQIILKARTAIQSDVVLLRDIAEIAGSDAPTIERLGELKIGMTPPVGYPDRILKEKVERLIRRRFPAATRKISWSGADETIVKASAQRLELREAVGQARQRLERSLRTQFPDIVEWNVQEVGNLTAVELPAGPVAARRS